MAIKKRTLQEEMVSHDLSEYKFFQNLSVEVLEGMVRDLTLGMDDSNDDRLALIMRVLRDKQGSSFHAESEEAWQAFCQSYDVSDFMIPAEQLSFQKSPTRPRFPFFPHFPRMAAILLVAFGITVFSLGVAQAAGWVDVIGFIFGRGHVIVSDAAHLPADVAIEAVDGPPNGVDMEVGVGAGSQLAAELLTPKLQTALAELGVDPHFPTWFPEGFVLQDVDVVPTVESGGRIKVQFSGGEKLIQLVIRKSAIPIALETEEDEELEEYPRHGVTYYLMHNLQQARALWKEGPVLIRISGDLTTDQLKKMIDSIGGTE